MTGQIKIIIEYQEEGIDSDITGPLSAANVKVYRDDEVIGFIQYINFMADALGHTQLEFIFPDLTGWAADEELTKKIDRQVKSLSEIVGVKILKRP